ncbi:hypothetical protein LZ32DRAFT_65534 [Colletotrichum eremochloae]|nr:hypothetical protein LZ32DRAFT_65534 [Colletotrichum eremochloae]
MLTKAAVAHRCLWEYKPSSALISDPAAACRQSGLQRKYTSQIFSVQRQTDRVVICVQLLRCLLRNQIMFSWLYNATPDAPMSYPMPSVHRTHALFVGVFSPSYSLPSPIATCFPNKSSNAINRHFLLACQILPDTPSQPNRQAPSSQRHRG